MKKILSILLISALALSSAVGVSAAISKVLPSDIATPDSAQANETAVCEEAPMLAQTDDYIVDLPDFTGTWKHVDDNGCSVQVVKQEGNQVWLTIESHNSGYTKIATSRLKLTLDAYADEEGPFGVAYFNYSDSFGSGGRGSIIIYEDKMFLEINKEYDPCAAWNITAADGEYYFYSNDVNPYEIDRFDHLPENQQITDFEVTAAPMEGYWENVNGGRANVQVLNLEGNNADLVLELSNENYTKIATAKVPVTFTTITTDTGFLSTADFEYCDSFGGTGTGTITSDGATMHLELNAETTGLWSVGFMSGDYVWTKLA
ncbi:MAG: hypothetical protein IJ433_07920 [Ruminococcus sp.]|nr:hypothetical protein [Ruminococcus sp.]